MKLLFSKASLFVFLFLFSIATLFILSGVRTTAEKEERGSIRFKYLLKDDIWSEVKEKYIRSSGQVVADDGTTSSESQSYALVISVLANDREVFDRVWMWTKDNLQREEDYLFSWKWEGGKIADRNSAADADTDIAFALYLAGIRWGEQIYRAESLKIMEDIWLKETVRAGNRRYIIGGAAGFRDDGILILNPSYLAPYAYRAFARIDGQHDWRSLVDGAYIILETCTSDVGLAFDWCRIDERGNLVKSDINSYDALRVNYRIALDYLLSGDERALEYLQKSAPVYLHDWRASKKIYAVYDIDGELLKEIESFARYGAEIAHFDVLGRAVSEEIVDQKLRPLEISSVGNFYDLAWLWFGLHIHTKGWGLAEDLGIRG